MSRLLNLPEPQLRAEFLSAFGALDYVTSEDASWQVAQIYARREALVDEMKRRGLHRTLAMLQEELS
jgi:hypothetical protein